jgi:hypothetical protein
MMPSIGYSVAAGAADRASNRSASRNSPQSKDESFDRVFSSTANDSDAHAGRRTSAGEPSAKESDSTPGADKQSNAQPEDVSAAASSTGAASASSSGEPTVSQRRPARSESSEPARRPRNAPTAADASVAMAGAPLDPSSLTMLLGAATARTANYAAESDAKGPETAGDKEAQPVAGLAPGTSENAAAPGAGLAFALRLSRAEAAPESDSSNSQPAASASLSSFANALEAAAKPAAEAKTHPGDENNAAIPLAATDTGVAAPASGNRPAAPEAAGNAAPAPAAEPASQASAPVRAVRVQLAAADNQRVDLTLVERAGALSVSVRSADSNLARSLQDHLPDLSARLSEQRYQTETFTPTPRVELPSASAGSAGSSESGRRNFESGGQKQGGQNGNSNPQQQQQGGRENEAPAWFEELAAMGRTPHIRSEYLWVQ